MGIGKFQTIAISGWLTALALGVAVSLAAGVALPPTTQVLFLLAAIVPTFLLVILSPGLAPKSVTQILYDQEHPSGDYPKGR